jgi:hypothetical protein
LDSEKQTSPVLAQVSLLLLLLFVVVVLQASTNQTKFISNTITRTNEAFFSAAVDDCTYRISGAFIN